MKKYMKKSVAITVLVILLLALTVPIASASGGKYHKVHYGETLFSIGRKYQVNPYHIADVNHLYNPHHIYAGQVLYIPSGYGYHDGYNKDYGRHDKGCNYGCDDYQMDYGRNRYDGCDYGCKDYQVDYDYGYKDGYGHDGYRGDYGYGSKNHHIVKRGETLSSIAYYYGVSPWALAKKNHIYNLHRIYAGEVLYIPSGYSNY